MDDKIERRDFLRGVGILASAAATTALSERPALARNASQTKAGSMTFQADEIIDFHSHHIPARFEVTAARTAPAAQRARWEVLARTLSDEDLLLRDIRDGELGARVVSIPAQLIADADGRVPPDTFMAMNDDLAALVARNPGRIHGQASVDAYDGDRAAREAERAIRELGLRGLFVECARGDLLINAPQARPTLEVAARLGVPVFVHPVAPQPLTRQMAPYGLIGTLFARGTVNSAALIALVEGEVFSQLPGLRVVVTAHAVGGLAMAAALSSQSRLPFGAIDVIREHVFIDTTLFHPALLRASIDLLGPDHVVAGSDWPIASDRPIRSMLEEAIHDNRFSDDERSAIASGNCLKLLGIPLNGQRAQHDHPATASPNSQPFASNGVPDRDVGGLAGGLK
jgi:predicted TIM-barrel fold metal-dependent hydrolase